MSTTIERTASSPRSHLENEEEQLERGRAEVRQEPPEEPEYSGGPPPPRPPDSNFEFPRFRGGDGNNLPRWQRLVIFGVMIFLSALLGALIGHSARIFARGLEAGQR